MALPLMRTATSEMKVVNGILARPRRYASDLPRNCSQSATRDEAAIVSAGPSASSSTHGGAHMRIHMHLTYAS